jgi:hypothetical protein
MNTCKNIIPLALSFSFALIRSAIADAGASSDPASAYLKSYLTLGEPPGTLLLQFGNPFYKYQPTSNELRMTFSFDHRTREQIAAGVGGFTAFFVSNKLARWEPTYVDDPIVIPPARLLSFNGDHTALSFAIVSRSAENDRDVYINTGAFPRLGYIGHRPSLSIRSGQYMVVAAGKAIKLVLNPDDSQAFKVLTTTNVGLRLACMAGTNVLCAPVITEPISDGEFVLDLSPSAYTRLRAALDKLSN